MPSDSLWRRSPSSTSLPCHLTRHMIVYQSSVNDARFSRAHTRSFSKKFDFRFRSVIDRLASKKQQRTASSLESTRLRQTPTPQDGPYSPENRTASSVNRYDTLEQEDRANDPDCNPASFPLRVDTSPKPTHATQNWLLHGLDAASTSSQIANVDAPLGDHPFFSQLPSITTSISTICSADAESPVRAQVYLYKTPSRSSAPNRIRPHRHSPSPDNSSSVSDFRTFYTACSSLKRSVTYSSDGRPTRISQFSPLQAQLLASDDAPATNGSLAESLKEEEQVVTINEVVQISSVPLNPMVIEQLSSLKSSAEAEAAHLVEGADEEFFNAAAASLFVSGTTDVTGRLKRLSEMPVAAGGNSDIWIGELQELPGKRLVAIKVLRAVRIKGGDQSTKLLLRMQREVRIWCQLQDEHIVPFIGFAFEGKSPCLISPWYSYGSVVEYVIRYPMVDRTQLVVNVIDGLIYLHSYDPPIIHGDLKAANVLIDDHGVARITDFGLSVILQDGQSEYTTTSALQGSVRWMAPELFFEPLRTRASDVYSLTLLALEILTGGTKPFHHLPDGMFLAAICHSASPRRWHYLGLHLPDQVWQVFEAGWSRSPESRPTANSLRTMYINAISPGQPGAQQCIDTEGMERMVEATFKDISTTTNDISRSSSSVLKWKRLLKFKGFRFRISQGQNLPD